MASPENYSQLVVQVGEADAAAIREAVNRFCGDVRQYVDAGIVPIVLIVRTMSWTQPWTAQTQELR